jgi:hypothetical protein
MAITADLLVAILDRKLDPFIAKFGAMEVALGEVRDSVTLVARQHEELNQRMHEMEAAATEITAIKERLGALEGSSFRRCVELDARILRIERLGRDCSNFPSWDSATSAKLARSEGDLRTLARKKREGSLSSCENGSNEDNYGSGSRRSLDGSAKETRINTLSKTLVTREDTSANGSSTVDSEGKVSSLADAKKARILGDVESGGTQSGDPTKLHISTFANTLVTKEAITALVHARMAEANIDTRDGRILGGVFGSAFAVRFKKAELTKQFMASLRGASGWVTDMVPLPNGLGETVKVFYNMDKTSKQRRIDYAWRKFRALVREAAAKLQSSPELQYDPRERIIACEWREVARLRVLEQDKMVVNWAANQTILAGDEMARISRVLDDILASESG